MKKIVNIKNLKFGEQSILIQSMLNKSPLDIDANINQALQLQKAGCDIIRVSIPNKQALNLIKPLKKAIDMPVVADIHFDYMLALASIDEGIDKIRINPGNIGSEEKIKAVVDKCKKHAIPIRIGVNSGSLEKEILEKFSHPTPEAMCESALKNIKILEKYDFNDIVVSIKMSDVNSMVKSYELLYEKCNYPLHLGVTESGTKRMGLIKSSIGIGSLLLKGIGDTIRVSLTADPVEEIYAAKDILKSLNLHKKGATMISCPTCGRTKIDLIPLAEKVENFLKDVDKKITVAVMGCAVNGPGEAREADIGIAAGDKEAILFKHGEVIRKIDEKDLFVELQKEILEI